MNMEIDTKKLLEEVTNEEEIIDLVFEENILEEIEDEFSYQIRERGKEYYNFGKVLKCCKSGRKYFAKVRGSLSKPYTVHIDYSDEYDIKFRCDCPYEYPCKHEYAVLMAISNYEYEEVELKPEITEEKNTLQSLIALIPANEIKDYLLSPKGLDYVCFEMQAFEEHFRKYLPKQKYDFYYNHLYNALVLNEDVNEISESYVNQAKQYIDNYDFAEGYKILKGIIEAYKDSNRLNFDNYIIDILPKMGMFLRVIYRKCDTITRENIDKWVISLKSSNYYNNLYLEDIIVSMKV